jgi:hypothetical protein
MGMGRFVKKFPNEWMLTDLTYHQTYMEVSLLVYEHPNNPLVPQKPLKIEESYLNIQKKCRLLVLYEPTWCTTSEDCY